ncbi:MAG: general secretion pathway protein GspD [Pirellulales bacterium]
MNTTTFSRRFTRAAMLGVCLTFAPTVSILPTAAAAEASADVEVSGMMAEARRAMDEGKFNIARSYIERVESMNPKFPLYYTGDTPKSLRAALTAKMAGGAMNMAGGAAMNAAAPLLNRAPTGGAPMPMPQPSLDRGVMQAGGGMPTAGGVQQSYYSGMNDASRVMPAGNNMLLPGASATGGMPAPMPGMPAPMPTARQEALPAPAASPYSLQGNMPAQATAPVAGKGVELLNAGEKALNEGNVDQALKLFRDAYAVQGDLDPAARTRLQDHLRILSRPAAPTAPGAAVDGADENQQLMAKRISAEISRTQTAAKELLPKDPRKAMEMLKAEKEKYAGATIDPAMKVVIQRRLDLSIGEAEQFIKANAAQIELDEKNKAVRGDVERSAQHRQEIDEKLVKMVTEFNQLVDEQRLPEAEVVAKRAAALAPNNPVTVSLLHNAKALRRMEMEKGIRAGKEEGIHGALVAADLAATPFNGEIMFPNKTDWQTLTRTRGERYADASLQKSPREREIEQRLNTPVMMKQEARPLREVLDYLEKVANISIHIDEAGLASESVDESAPVTLKLTNEIPLRSALNLILPKYRLNYMIKNDVLIITSEQKTKGLVYTKSYQVADLVIPIPNFVPTGNEGLVNALKEGYKGAAMGRSIGGYMPAVAAMPVSVAATGDGGSTTAQMHPQALAQQMQNNPSRWMGGGGPPATGMMQQPQFGPGGMGGGAQADFDSLIELVQSTVQPNTWKANGGQGDIAPFETNLTLVVSNTQEVHEQLADLLQQLRRLQDLQVTIEVRFITLSDNFFERIGVDFDFTIDNNAALPARINSRLGPSEVVGLDVAGSATSPTVTSNLQVPFTQGSFTEGTVPAFPGIGFNPATAGSFGFAILSDIEAFFLIQAAQGDTRNNILQAPKVTLFNGQSAFISDTAQRPFVTSIIPVVGDFAAAQQPVIVVLSEGTSLTVQAVVSNDRRFVRLTVVPFFSQIGDVDTFTFTGSSTSTTKDSSSSNGTDDSKTATKDATTFTEGTTVQLPTFAFVTVTTTVSVPDGGTVLLGGIKRLSEGRNERGIPILSKIPYINRLFKNVGIGRSTQSLMMMVTPRIIIQEEEEEKLIGAPTS